MINHQDNGRNELVFSLIFGGSGVAHFVLPDLFIPLLPARVPGRAGWVYLSGAVELLVAAGLQMPRWRRAAARGMLVLLLLFTPLHVLDLLRDRPVIGSKPAAVARLAGQVVMLVLAWRMRGPLTADH